MKTTLTMQIVSELGDAAWHWAGSDRIADAEASPAASFANTQPAHVPVSIRHLDNGGRTVGRVTYLERGIDNPDLTAVAVIDGLDADMFNDEPVYASAEISRRFENRSSAIATESRLHAVAIVDETASVAAKRIVAVDGDYRNGAARMSWPYGSTPGLLERAIAATGPNDRYETRGTIPLLVHRPPPQQVGDMWIDADGEPVAVRSTPTPHHPPATDLRPLGPIYWSAPYKNIISVR